jgi:hypothetical protein
LDTLLRCARNDIAKGLAARVCDSHLTPTRRL